MRLLPVLLVALLCSCLVTAAPAGGERVRLTHRDRVLAKRAQLHAARNLATVTVTQPLSQYIGQSASAPLVRSILPDNGMIILEHTLVDETTGLMYVAGRLANSAAAASFGVPFSTIARYMFVQQGSSLGIFGSNSSWSLLPSPGSTSTIDGLHRDKNGNLWRASAAGLYFKNATNGKWVTQHTRITNDVTSDGNGNIYTLQLDGSGISISVVMIPANEVGTGSTGIAFTWLSGTVCKAKSGLSIDSTGSNLYCLRLDGSSIMKYSLPLSTTLSQTGTLITIPYGFRPYNLVGSITSFAFDETDKLYIGIRNRGTSSPSVYSVISIVPDIGRTYTDIVGELVADGFSRPTVLNVPSSFSPFLTVTESISSTNDDCRLVLTRPFVKFVTSTGIRQSESDTSSAVVTHNWLTIDDTTIPLTVEPSIIPTETSETFTLSDNGAGGSFDPTTVTFQSTSSDGTIVAYRPALPGVLGTNITFTAISTTKVDYSTSTSPSLMLGSGSYLVFARGQISVSSNYPAGSSISEDAPPTFNVTVYPTPIGTSTVRISVDSIDQDTGRTLDTSFRMDYTPDTVILSSSTPHASIVGVPYAILKARGSDLPNFFFHDLGLTGGVSAMYATAEITYIYGGGSLTSSSDMIEHFTGENPTCASSQTSATVFLARGGCTNIGSTGGPSFQLLTCEIGTIGGVTGLYYRSSNACGGGEFAVTATSTQGTTKGTCVALPDGTSAYVTCGASAIFQRASFILIAIIAFIINKVAAMQL